jgi:anti-sigma regulatory factor (Ser/Thr protein kinase)
MESLTVPGTLDSLETIRQYVMEAAKNVGLEKKKAYSLCLAIDEIATNIILYGYEDAGLQGSLELQTQVSDEGLTIAVEDHAAPYDPRNTPPPDLTSSWEDRPMGGLGVHFAMTGVDKFHYERVNGRNRNIFVIHIPALEKTGPGQ